MRKLVLVISLLVCAVAQAQTCWINPLDSGAVVHGQGWAELRSGYNRLPDRAEGIVRSPVWALSRNSAGLSLVFRSNSENIIVRYAVKGGLNMFHMPSTGVSGVDMYATDKDGMKRWCAADFTPTFRDTITYRYSGLTYLPEGPGFFEYHLYFPLYNTVDWMEIGVDEGAWLDFQEETRRNPIVIYGTSITQGACASRPGMAWTNIVERELALPVVNLGFSGNGRMEPEMFSLLSEIDAGMYIVDCLPNNNNPSDAVTEKVLYGVRLLRKSHTCPILLVEHSGYSHELSNASAGGYRNTNKRLRAAYDQLTAEGVESLYYMTTEEIGMGMDGMVEGRHPNDLGMRRHADGFEKKILEILKMEQVKN